MRSALLIAALTLAAGCHEQDQDARINGLVAYRDEWRSTAERLQAELTMLKMSRGAPHLVAKDGTDLGYSLGGNCALNAEAGGEVCFPARALLSFADPDCTGQPYLDSDNPVRSSVRYLGLGNTWLRPDGEPTMLTLGSQFSPQLDRCGPASGQESSVPLVDTGIAGKTYRISDLSIELH